MKRIFLLVSTILSFSAVAQKIPFGGSLITDTAYANRHLYVTQGSLFGSSLQVNGSIVSLGSIQGANVVGTSSVFANGGTMHYGLNNLLSARNPTAGKHWYLPDSNGTIGIWEYIKPYIDSVATAGGYVPTSRTINGYDLTTDRVLDFSDLGDVVYGTPSNHQYPEYSTVDGKLHFATPSGGTVTSIATTTPITGGTITSTGTIGIGGMSGYGTVNQLVAMNNSGTGWEYKSFATGTSGTDFSFTTGAGSLVVNLPAADGTHTGKLSSTDWTTFNNKVATTRTVSTNLPLTGGGDMSADRTLSIGGLSSYGSANQILGMNNPANGMEFKTISAGSGISVTNGTSAITIQASEVVYKVTGIDLKSTGNTTVITTATGQGRFFVTQVKVNITSVSGFSANASVSVGQTAAAYTDIASNQALSAGLNTLNSFQALSLVAPGVSVAANTPIVFKVNTGATATTLTATVFITGHYENY